MIKTSVIYTDYAGNKRKQDIYFNLTKIELTEMFASGGGDVSEMLQRMVDDREYKDLLLTFKSFVAKAYGVRSDDGKYFEKSDELSNKFLHSAAFNQLCENIFFTEGGTNLALRLMVGALPKDLQGKVPDDTIKNIEKEIAKRAN